MTEEPDYRAMAIAMEQQLRASLTAAREEIGRLKQLTPALADVAAERARQVNEEGWTPSHDDDHGNAQLARAAAAYAIHTAADTYSDPLSRLRVRNFAKEAWPWADDWFKPSDARRNLVKAGALILAEIERLDRAALAGGESDAG